LEGYNRRKWGGEGWQGNGSILGIRFTPTEVQGHERIKQFGTDAMMFLSRWLIIAIQMFCPSFLIALTSMMWLMVMIMMATLCSTGNEGNGGIDSVLYVLGNDYDAILPSKIIFDCKSRS
jgi:hypothetical protein